MTLSNRPRPPGYRRAFSSLGLPAGGLDDLGQRVRQYGLDGVELRALGGSIDLPAYFEEKYGKPAELAREVHRAGLQVFSLSTSLRLLASGPGEREAFLRFVPWAEALGVPWLRVFDGGRSGDDLELAQAAATVRWWRELRAHNQWHTDLLMEAHDVLADGAALRRFVAAVPGVPLLWDTHFTWRRSGEDPVATWRQIGEHVRQLHVKDSIGQPGEHDPFTLVLPGAGEFPMARLRVALDSAFTGVMSLEWEKHWRPMLPALDEALHHAAKVNWW